MSGKTLALAALAAATFLSTTGVAFAQTPTIFQSTLGETTKSAEISTEQLREILRDRTAIVLDTRTRAEFDAGHIPGARNLDAAPAQQISATMELVQGDKSKALVLYCNGPYCQASRRLADQLIEAGFGNVRRYQLGIPVWRALGNPVVIELDGVVRVARSDRSAVFVDARNAAQFAKATLPGAISAPVQDVLSGAQKKIALPEDDFNRRIILFGDGDEARKLADYMSKRPWHNVSYFLGSYESLGSALNGN